MYGTHDFGSSQPNKPNEVYPRIPTRSAWSAAGSVLVRALYVQSVNSCSWIAIISIKYMRSQDTEIFFVLSLYLSYTKYALLVVSRLHSVVVVVVVVCSRCLSFSLLKCLSVLVCDIHSIGRQIRHGITIQAKCTICCDV